MLKFIGAAGVYGFATYGLFAWLQKIIKDDVGSEI